MIDMDSNEQDIWSDDEWKTLMQLYFNFFENAKDSNGPKLNAYHHIKYKSLYYLDKELKNTNDYALFYDNVYNPFSIYSNEKNIVRDAQQRHFNASIALSNKTKKIIHDYFNVILNDDYQISNNEKHNELYFMKLFIPVFLGWTAIRKSSIIDEIEEFNKIIQPLLKIDTHLFPPFSYICNKLFHCNKCEQSMLLDMIDFMKTC